MSNQAPPPPCCQTLIGFGGSDAPDDESINACIHCAMCLSSCPTYRETHLEMSSPRGRIFLMKAVQEGRMGLGSAVFQEQMAQCLNCRACEAVCPVGVPYGTMLEASRAQIEQARHPRHGDPLLLPTAEGGNTPETPAVLVTLAPRPWWQRILRQVVFDHLFMDMRLFRTFSRAMALYQRSGAQRLARASGLLDLLGMGDMEALLPPINRSFTIPRGQIYRPTSKRRHVVALLSGCIMSTAFVHVHDATIRVLQKNGCEVLLPPEQGCCGALHLHSGDLEGGRTLARRAIAAFEGVGADAIITNAAGCGSTLKEYGHLLKDDPLWRERAEAFSARVRDIHEFLVDIGFNHAELGPLPLSVTYQEPCHLAHAQRITRAPRALLEAIPALELREMEESALCCGSAGVYNITQPQMAAQLGARKASQALATGADIIATANPGCAVQLAGELHQRGALTPVRYIVELLDESYRNTR